MRLLAVDDDPLVLDLLSTIFAQANLPDISVASSGAAALKLLSRPDFNVDGLILDISMPGLSGVELCQAVRKMPRHQHKPILMLTSVKDNATVERAFAAGADDYITKPFDVKDIVARVRVAERMAQKAPDVPLLDPAASSTGDAAGRHSFGIESPLRIADTANLVQPFALGNYLAQLSRQRLDTCSIFAVHLCGIDSLFDTLTTADLARALHGIVQAVSQVVDCSRLLTAYEGNGILMCITRGAAPLDWPLVEHRIRTAIAAQGLRCDDGTEMRLDISVGNPVTPSASRYQRVNKTFDRTRERALSRTRSKTNKAG